MRAEDLLAGCDEVFVAFDGPVAALPPVPVADRLRLLVAEAPLPRRVARTGDPFAVLAHAATIGPATERAVYALLCRVEFELVGQARLAEGVAGAFAAMSAAGTRLCVVSGFCAEAVRSFLVVHGLDAHVRHLVARGGPGDDVAAALRTRAGTGSSCVFVGGTRADLAAARAAGLTAVRYRPVADREPAGAEADRWFGALSQPVRRLL
jgi:phosphoglycolate phosphatase-like HAD superfamily hydrolase